MAQAIQITSVALPPSKDKKTYTVNFKGLIAHLLDVLFVGNAAPHRCYAEELSAHIQKDIGMCR